MTNVEKVFLIILAVNLIIVIFYMVWNYIKNKEESMHGYWLKAIVMLLCPIVGIFFLIISHIFYLLFFSEPVDLEAVVFSKERVRTFVHADEEGGRNLVPLEEAIEVTNTDELRGLMMNVVRGDISKSLAAISLALNSEDTETAHYAASVLQDALNEFRATVQKDFLLMQSEENPDNKVTYAGMLLGYMNQVLEQKVLSDLEQESYVLMMEDVGQVLYDTNKEKMTSAQYENIAIRLLELKQFERCEKWCERAKYQYPNTLSSYTCQLKLYFNSGNKDRFFEVIGDLKKSAIVIDNETLELIRVFS